MAASGEERCRVDGKVALGRQQILMEQPNHPTPVVHRRRRPGVRGTEKHSGCDPLVVVPVDAADYLGYLRRERICYLVAGDEPVGLAGALERMATRLGIGAGPLQLSLLQG
jgi:hypothetical protein